MALRLSDGPGRWIAGHRPLFVLAVAALALAAGTATLLGREFRAAALVADALELRPRAQLSRVLDAAGRPVWSLGSVRRVSKPLDAVSPHMVAAALAAEDRAFFSHGGVDLRRIVGAAVANLHAGRVVQGASTLTQQVVRQLTNDRQRDYARKMREAFAAWHLERRVSKRAILEAYLNSIYFGRGCYGVEAAAHGYFGKSAADLDASQSATLAALIHAPSAYDVRRAADRERLRQRRNYVLRAMVEAGAVSDAAASSMAAAGLAIIDDERRVAEAFGLYFREAVRQELAARLGADAVDRGLRIYSTLDVEGQRAAEAAVSARLASLRDRREPDRRLQGALVAIDPRSGEVRALVGGRSFVESPFDRARQARRQPGSAFKPIVYAAAIEAGFTPESLLVDLDLPVPSAEGPWLPADEREPFEATLREGLRWSSNWAAVHLFVRVGDEAVRRYARDLGIRGALPRVPSLALGTGEVTLLELTNAYVPFANGGWSHHPHFIRRIEDAQGRTLFDARAAPARVLRPTTAFQMTSMLEDVVTRGTGHGVRQAGVRGAVAGKTGTTDDYADAWFVGYTPTLVAGIWFGADEPSTILRDGFASTVAVPAWSDFMRRVSPPQPARRFERPSSAVSVQLCAASRQLASDWCRAAALQKGDPARVYWTTMSRRALPKHSCPLHLPARDTP